MLIVIGIVFVAILLLITIVAIALGYDRRNSRCSEP